MQAYKPRAGDDLSWNIVSAPVDKLDDFRVWAAYSPMNLRSISVKSNLKTPQSLKVKRHGYGHDASSLKGLQLRQPQLFLEPFRSIIRDFALSGVDVFLR